MLSHRRKSRRCGSGSTRQTAGLTDGGCGGGGRWLALLAMVVAIAAYLPAAVAADDHEHLFERLTPAQEQAVVELLDLAEKAYDEGQFRSARARFNEAYALFPHPDLLYRIGRCYEQMGRAELAIDHYRHYLREVPEARGRGRIEQTIANLEDQVVRALSQVRMETFPIGADLYVDSQAGPVGQTPRDITLEPGEYVIIIKKEGTKTERQTVMLEGGDRLRYQLRLIEVEGQGDDGGPYGRSRRGIDWWKPAVSMGLVAVGAGAIDQAAGHEATYREDRDERDALRGVPATPERDMRRFYLVDRMPVERSLAVSHGVVGQC